MAKRWVATYLTKDGYVLRTFNISTPPGFIEQYWAGVVAQNLGPWLLNESSFCALLKVEEAV